MLSEKVENYLKNIYKLQEKKKQVSTTLLSEALSVSPASVTEMIKKLSDAGIVTYEPYRGVQLTPSGRKKALRIIRRHRLWELFLVEVLKYPWDEIDEEAERLEHITSGRLENRLDAFLGYPRRDPHGDVIPTAEGTIKNPGYAALAECNPGTTVILSRVSDESPEMLKYLSQLGISLKKKVSIKEKIPFDGSLRVVVDEKEQFISQKLANHMFTEKDK